MEISSPTGMDEFQRYEAWAKEENRGIDWWRYQFAKWKGVLVHVVFKDRFARIKSASIADSVVALSRIASNIGIILAPIVIRMATGDLSWGVALWSTAILAILQIVRWFTSSFEQFRELSKNRRKIRMDLLTRIVTFIGRLRQHSKITALTGDINPMIQGVLEAILDETRLLVADYLGTEVEVNLLVFQEIDGSTMNIAYRARMIRPKGTTVPSAKTMAYYVAKTGKHRVLHDFRGLHPFPKSSLSDNSEPSYRSIVFIPLIEGDGSCLGVLTVDSKKPFHFWPKKGDDLVLRANPYIAFLKMLLAIEHPKVIL